MNPSTMPIAELFDRYKTDNPLKHVTIVDIKRALAKLDVALGRPAVVSDLKMTTIETLIRHVHEAGQAVSTINQSVTHVCALWSFAHDLRLCLWPAPSPRPYFDPKAPGLIVRPPQLERGRRKGGKRIGVPARPAVTKLDKTLWSHFELLYRRQRLLGKSPETVRLYGFTFDYFADFLGREPLLPDLQDDTIISLMEWIVGTEMQDGRQGRGLQPRTANKARDQLCALWGFLAKKAIVKTWPEVPHMTEPERDPVAWTTDELRKLWDVCENQRGTISGVPAGKWWLALHSVAWDTLERIGALRQVLWSDVSDDYQWMHFRAEVRKGRKRDFTAKMHPTTMALLDAIWQPDGKLVFPWNMNEPYLWTKYRNLRRTVGLPVDHLHSFHCIRRTGASFAEAAGFDATALLGHSSRKVTVKHYLDPRMTPRIHGADILFRPDAPAEPTDVQAMAERIQVENPHGPPRQAGK